MFYLIFFKWKKKEGNEKKREVKERKRGEYELFFELFGRK